MRLPDGPGRRADYGDASCIKRIEHGAWSIAQKQEKRDYHTEWLSDRQLKTFTMNIVFYPMPYAPCSMPVTEERINP